MTPKEDAQTHDVADETPAEIPGDTQAPDIVSRTGEEMPEVAHDETERDDELGHSGNPKHE